MIWYVKHRLRDGSVETFRCDSKSKARGISRDLNDAGEAAWVQNEEGLAIPDWDT